MGENNDDHGPNWVAVGWTASEEEVSEYIVIFITLLGIVLVLSKWLHDRPAINRILPEAGMTILVGAAAGCVVRYVAPPREEYDDDDSSSSSNMYEGLLNFSSTIFFVALLPPIVFNAGYCLRRELFFRYIQPIFLLASLGTTLSTLTVGVMLKTLANYNLTGGFNPSLAELFTFGAMISTTDTVTILAVLEAKRVDPHLFYLVFGESAMNDAVGLVLFNAFSKQVGFDDAGDPHAIMLSCLNIVLDFMTIFVGSFLWGALSGLLAGLLLKWIDMRANRLLELSLFILVMYFPFLLAEVLGLSGIVTIFFSGMSAKQYATPNLSAATENDADAIFRVTAFLAETIIFLELGLSVFGIPDFEHNHFVFTFWALLASLIGRAMGVYPVSFLFNRMYKQMRKILFDDYHAHDPVAAISREKPYIPDLKITWTNCHMLWLSGLRGAVAYACAKNFPKDNGNRSAFVFTTIFIVLFTVFVMGGTTECALMSLNVSMYVDEEEYMKTHGKWITKGWFYEIEKKYIYPLVIRNYTEVASREEEGGLAYAEMRESFEDRIEIQSIEMTELGHLGIVKRMEVDRQLEYSHMIKQNVMKKRSIYDYGF